MTTGIYAAGFWLAWSWYPAGAPSCTWQGCLGYAHVVSLHCSYVQVLAALFSVYSELLAVLVQ